MTLDELEKSIRETEIELIRLKSRGPLRRPSESEDEVRKKLVELELKLIGLKLQAEYMRRDDRRGAKVIYPVYREFCYED